ncbi:hypothetical protein DFJ73DRAFT_821849 [Zopfochytrium polystomum]|nr:hypothetical protein DFJ73DRAFT_821849 [Zopfochytrium polystomum]
MSAVPSTLPPPPEGSGPPEPGALPGTQPMTTMLPFPSPSGNLAVGMPVRAQDSVLAHLAPPELLLLAPLVCKRWRRAVRSSLSPRVVLLNLRLIVSAPKNRGAAAAASCGPPPPAAPDNSNNADGPGLPPGNLHLLNDGLADRPSARASAIASVTIQRPAPLDAFCFIPADTAARLGLRPLAAAGEGTVVTCKFEDVPTTVEGLQAFLDAIKTVLRGWLPSKALFPDDEDESRRIVLVPWEVQISGHDSITAPEDLQSLARLLAFFNPSIFKIAFPPPILLHLLPPGIQVLHLFTCRQHIDPIDFSPLRQLASGQPSNGPRFGSSLVRLVLDSPLDPVETDNKGYVDAEDLEDLRFLAPTLKELGVGGYFPLTNYRELLPILREMKNLTRLTIKGLDQSDIPPSDLAETLRCLTNLESLNDLCNVDSTFWAALVTSSTPPAPRLRELTLLWDHPSTLLIRVGLVGVLRCFPKSLKNLRIDLTAVEDITAPPVPTPQEDDRQTPEDAAHETVQRLAGLSIDEGTPSPAAAAAPLALTPMDVLTEVARMAVAQKAGVLPVTELEEILVVGLRPSLEELALVGKLNMDAAERLGPRLRFKGARH